MVFLLIVGCQIMATLAVRYDFDDSAGEEERQKTLLR